jgi:MFS family permease
MGYAAVGAASLLLPLYALSLGAGPLLVGLMASTAAFAGVPGAVLWGKLAGATHRRRPLILIALGATAAVLVVVPWISSPWILLAANAALWFVVSAAAPVLNLVVVEGVPSGEWDRQFARLNSYQGYGWLAGLLVGAGWNAVVPELLGAATARRTLFYVVAAAAAGGLAVVSARYPTSPSRAPRRLDRVVRQFHRESWGGGGSLRAIPFGPSRLYWGLRSLRTSWGGDRRLLRRGRGRDAVDALRARLSDSLGRFLVAAALFFVGSAVFFGPLPAYLADAGYDTGEVFALFVLSSAGSAVAYGPSGVAAERHDARWLQVGAALGRTVAFPLIVLVGAASLGPLGLGLAGAILAAVGVTWAVVAVTGPALVTRLAAPPVRGEALGVYTAVGGLGGGVGSALGGALAGSVGYLGAFGLAALLVAAAGGLIALDCLGDDAPLVTGETPGTAD